MRKTRHQIHWQLAAYTGAVICVLMGLFLVIDRIQQWRNLVDARSASMQQEVQLLALALEREPSSNARVDFLTHYCAMMRYHGKPGHALAVLDPSGSFHATGKRLTQDDLTQSAIVAEANAKNERAHMPSLEALTAYFDQVSWSLAYASGSSYGAEHLP